jgi:hypothetical protein
MNDVRLSDDDRYALAARAEAGARSNRPSHLIAIAALALLMTLVVAGFAWRSDARAARLERNAARDLTTLRASAERLGELQARVATSPEVDRNRPIPDILSRLGSLAREAGLDPVPPIPTQSSDIGNNARRLNYQYQSLRSPSLAAVLRWVNLCTERIPGMHVRVLIIKPAPTLWSVDVTFARYERLE